MKFILVLFAILAVSAAKPAKPTPRDLRDDLDDFLALIPVQELKDLYHKYEDDPDIQKIVAYLKSEDFAAVMHIVANNADVQDLVQYIEDEGVPIIDFLNRLADRLGLPHWPGSFMKRNTRSLQDFLQEALEIVPVDEIVALALEKLGSSEAFQNLYLKISSMPGQQLHDDALAHPEIQDLVDRLNGMGINTGRIWTILKILFDW